MRYDVTLSFAGEYRAYVEEMAAQLRRAGLRFFYGNSELADLRGQDLSEIPR